VNELSARPGLFRDWREAGRVLAEKLVASPQHLSPAPIVRISVEAQDALDTRQHSPRERSKGAFDFWHVATNLHSLCEQVHMMRQELGAKVTAEFAVGVF